MTQLRPEMFHCWPLQIEASYVILPDRLKGLNRVVQATPQFMQLVPYHWLISPESECC
jgi:hypothetical protein